jgi:hypothetical protein
MIFFFKLWVSIVPEEIKQYGLILIIIAAFGIFFHWLFIIGLGLNNSENTNTKNKEFRKYKNWLLYLFLILSISNSYFIIYLVKYNNPAPIIIQIISSVFSIYLISRIIKYLTEEFKYFDKGIKPNLSDYIIMFFQMFFFPFGLIILHSHMRLILKKSEK